MTIALKINQSINQGCLSSKAITRLDRNKFR